MSELSARLGWTIAALALTLGACSNEATSVTGTGTGTAGTTGGAGTTGSAGTTGGAGTTGTAGTTGSAGTTGAAGTTGGAGTTGTAGTTGSAGTTGTAGTTGAAGTGGSNLPHAMPSAGCGIAATQPLMSYVKYMEMVTGPGVGTKQSPRNYYVWLPSGYDKNRAYPTVFIGPGCGSNGTQGIQIQAASTSNAIVIGLDPSTNVDPGGRQCFDSQSMPNPEIPYVEQTVAAVEAQFCVDKSRLFIEGFSSGSWLSYLMGCVDGGPGGLFRAQGNASGEDQGWNGGTKMDSFTCKGPTPWLGGHNNPDGNNGYPGGRDHMIKMNGCTTPPVTTPFDAGPMVKAPKAGVTIDCQQYMGCMVPTIFCTTTGLGHDPQESTGITTFGMWKFWMSLP